MTRRRPHAEVQPALFDPARPSLFGWDVPPWEGAAPSPAPAAEAVKAAPAVATTYTVQCYVTLRVTLTGIVADDHRSAAMTARDRFSLDEQGSEAEFVDEVSTFLVTPDGVTDPAQAVAFRVNWSPVPVDDSDEMGPPSGPEERRSP